MTIAPIITVNPIPGLSVNTGIPGLTYESILSSMGVFVYAVEKLFYQSSSINQFSNPIQYSIYDANGNISSSQVITPIGTNQYQPTMYVSMDGIILDGQSGLNFNMNPQESIRFIFYSKRRSNQEFIDMAGGINNFKENEILMQLLGFFDTNNEDE